MSMLEYYKQKNAATAGKSKKPTSWLDYYKNKNAGVKDDSQARTDQSNQNRLAKMTPQDQQAFEQYKKPGILGNLKTLGSNVLDVVSRPEYAVAGAAEERAKRNETFPNIQPSTYGKMATRAGRELFSGIGNIQGDKVSIPDVLKKYDPDYNQFAQEHPIASIGTDLAMSVAGDPTTLIPGKAFATAGKGLGKGVALATKPLRGTEAYKGIAKTLGTTFDPKYLWKISGAESGYDILWKEGNQAKYLREKLQTSLKPFAETVATWEVPKIKQFIKAMYGDADAVVTPDVAATVEGLRIPLRTMGSRELKYGAGHKMLENYFPNNPKQLADLMDNIGDYVPSGHGRGMSAWKKEFEHGKVLRTGDDFLGWLAEKGIQDDKLPEVVSRLLYGRAGSSAARIRQIRTHARWTKELPETFRELPPGRYKAWSSALQPGEAAWMPSGNLRFFTQSKWDVLPADVKEILEKGGHLTDEMAEKLDKEMLGVTANVKAYAVPKEVLEAMDSTSKRLGKPNGVIAWFDRALNAFKNTAILSPFFHERNFIGGGFENYLADMNPQRYGDILNIFQKARTGKMNDIVLGKSVGGWVELMKRNGVMGGSFVGQQTGRTGIPIIENVFKANRWVGSHVEDVNRGALFVDQMVKGADELTAAKTVKKYHFDYDELTDVERELFRRILPFYTWQRRNIPLQLEKIFTAPQKYRNLAKLKRAIEGDEESKNNPDWWANQDVWATKFKLSDIPVANLFTSSDDKAAISMGLPYSDLSQVMQNPTGSMGLAGAAMSLATNYDPFYKENIQQFKGQKEDFIQIGDKTIRTNPRFKYALEHILPVAKRYGTDLSREISMIATGQADDDTKLKALSKLIGVRLMPITQAKQDRQRIYQLKRELDDYTKYKKQEQGGDDVR